MKFCARCGKKGKTAEGLCEKCYLDMHPAIDVSKEVVIKICENCNKAFHRNIWSRYHNLEETIESTVKESIKIRDKFKIMARIKDGEAEARVRIIKTEEEYLVPIKIKKVTCDKCKKEARQYFEGVLQLRGVDERIINWVFRDIEKRERGGVFAQDVVELKNGLDIKLTSQKYLQALGAKLKKKFKGTVKITRTLFTRNKQTSKPVYRLTLLYKQDKG